jgi:pimeloyl-ACP methyl ester carboxylesterase
MLEIFPDARSGPNYWPNHMVSMLINSGLTSGEAAEAVAPALAEARAGRDATTEEFRKALISGVEAVANRLENLAQTDAAAGRHISARNKWMRTSVLLEALDWQFWPYGSPDPANPGTFFRKARTAFKKAVPDGWFKLPFEGHELDALFVPVPGARGPTPVVLHLNGQHSSLHWHYHMGLPQLLAERGVASMFFDHPGVGDARYNLGLKARADTESYVGAALDYLEARAEADATRVCVLGGSLGGYRAPRAAAYEPRLAGAIAWGAHYEMYDSIAIDWPDVGRNMLINAPMTPDQQKIVDSLHYWAGTSTFEALDKVMRALSLKGFLDRIRCPLLMVHGENDIQLPIWHAELTIAEAVNSSRAELLIVRPEMGGSQHCNWDDPTYALHAMSDWAAKILGAKA